RLAGEDFRAFRTIEQIRIETELNCQRPVQLDQPGRGHRRRRHAGEEIRRQRRIGVLEREMYGHSHKIGMGSGFFEPRAVSVPIEIETEALGFCFDAFSWREPVPTSLENALKQPPQSVAAPRGLGHTLMGSGSLLAPDSTLRHLFSGPPCIVTEPIPAARSARAISARPFGCRAG